LEDVTVHCPVNPRYQLSIMARRGGASVVFSPFHAPPLTVARVAVDSVLLFVFLVLFFRLYASSKYTSDHRAPFVVLPLALFLLFTGELFTIIVLRWDSDLGSKEFGFLIGGAVTELVDPLLVVCVTLILYEREKDLRAIAGVKRSPGFKRIFEWGFIGLF